MSTNTPVDRDAAIALLRAGQRPADIAEHLKCSRRTVERIRSAEGLPLQRVQRTFSWDELAAIELALADGASVAEALRGVGRNPKCWYRRFRGRGWSQAQRAEFVVMRKQAKRMGIEL